jgi:hypothetical protein
MRDEPQYIPKFMAALRPAIRSAPVDPPTAPPIVTSRAVSPARSTNTFTLFIASSLPDGTSR